MDEKTLLDYFAAHAPAEISEWFQPKDAYAKPTHPEPAPEIAGPAKAWLAKAWLRDTCYDFAGSFDKPDPSHSYCAKYRPLAEQFESAVQAYEKQCAATEKANTEHRYFAWRWYYAEMMMNHREEH